MGTVISFERHRAAASQKPVTWTQVTSEGDEFCSYCLMLLQQLDVVRSGHTIDVPRSYPVASVRSAHKRPNRPSDHPACAMPPPTEAIPAVCHEPTPAAPQASTAENRLCSRCSSRHARSLGVGPPARGQRRAGPSDGRHNCLTGLANGHDALSGGNPAVSMPAHLRRP